MKAEIVAVGTELLLGQICNGNARFLSEKLAELGIDVYWHSTVGDNAARLAGVLKTALARADILVICGGLGPTMDDLTRETAADVLGVPLELNREWEQHLQQLFLRLGRRMADNNRRQAFVPFGAQIIFNKHGTAPGIWLEHGRQLLVLLPGPPRELEPMFVSEVVPRLQKFAGSELIVSRVLKVASLGESALEEAIADLVAAQSNPTIATLAQYSEIHLRLTAKAGSREAADCLLDGMEEKLRGRLGESVFGRDGERLEEQVASLLMERRLTLAVSESCTGGLLAELLTSVPGSSSYFLQGLVTYSNRSKAALLGISPALLRKYGAVSPEVAGAMAENGRKLAGSDLCLATTGIADPAGGTEEKPVGLVYIACSSVHGLDCRRFNFAGTRKSIRERAAATGLNLLRLKLLNRGI
jgi:nicotinamide-nucleotide amidase